MRRIKTSKLPRPNGDRNRDFAGAVALEEEATRAGLAAFDGDGDGGLALGDDDLRHDNALGDIGGHIDEEAAGRRGNRDIEGERLAFTAAQGEGGG